MEKSLMLGKIEGRRRRGQQRMRWHDQLGGHEFEQALGVGDGQGGLVCCSPWGCKELDTTELLASLWDALMFWAISGHKVMIRHLSLCSWRICGPNQGFTGFSSNWIHVPEKQLPQASCLGYREPSVQFSRSVVSDSL